VAAHSSGAAARESRLAPGPCAFENLKMRRIVMISNASFPTLETTQLRIDDFLGQLLFKCYLPEVASLGDLT